MEKQINKFRILSNLLWKLMEMGGTQGIQFIVQLVLARLLFPEDYGVIAIVAIFITIARVFVHSGFNTALIQKKNVDEKDYSSVFFLSIFISGIIYIILFLTSPFIAQFFREPLLKPVLRVISVILFLGAFKSVQVALIARKLLFKKLFFSSLGAIIISGVIAIITAYLDYGVWALVIQQTLNNLFIVIILLIVLKWRPKLYFSIKRIKILFSYSWKLLLSSLIDHIYMNIRSIIVGRIYSSSTLGFYNNGKLFPNLIVKNINGSIQSVMFPVLSNQQDKIKNVKNIVRRSIVTSSFIIFPIMIGLAAISESFIKIVLTDKWLPAVPFLQIFCFTYLLWPIHTANLQAIKAIGRSDIFLKLEIIKKASGILILIISVFYGLYAIVIGGVISGIISTFINAYPNKRLLNYSYIDQLKDIIPSFLLSIFMGLLIFSINFISINIYIKLILQIMIGILIYILLARLFRLESYNYLKSTIKELYEKYMNIS